MIAKIFLWLLFIVTLLPPEASLAAAEVPTKVQTASLCRTEEQVIFTCTATGSAKLISLCASKSLDNRRGYLQYRYGKPGTIELQFPQARANTQLAFRYAHYFRAQVDRTEITFDNQDHRYTLFDYFDSDVKPAIAVAGVRVSKHRTKQSDTEMQCRARPTNKLTSLENVISRDADNALNK